MHIHIHIHIHMHIHIHIHIHVRIHILHVYTYFFLGHCSNRMGFLHLVPVHFQYPLCGVLGWL